MCTPDRGCTGDSNDIDAGTDSDFVGACTPALRMSGGTPLIPLDANTARTGASLRFYRACQTLLS